MCSQVGLDLDQIDPEIRSRMTLLAETTETVNDCARAAALAEEVFRYYDLYKPFEKFSAIERRTVVLGTLFSDIGKTGPADANEHGQRLVAEMFAVEQVLDDKMPVTRFFTQFFVGDAVERVDRFRALGLDEWMSMREFWNLHSVWTLCILQGDGVPKEAVSAAATHHLLENVNPAAILTEGGRLDRYLGAHGRFERPEKLVVLLDKYDAARRRGRRPHADALTWLRGLIQASVRFRGDVVFLSLIDAIDEVGRPRMTHDLTVSEKPSQAAH